MRPSPSARSVPRWRKLCPISLRTWVIFTLGIRRRLLRGRSRNDGSLGSLLLDRPLPREHVVDRKPARLRDVLRAAQLLERVDRGAGHVDRVRGTEALREDVANPGELEDRAHAAAGDDAGALAGRTQEHPSRVELAERLVRDRRAVLRDGEEVLLRVVDG